MAKGLGGGYIPISAMMISHKINNALFSGSGKFVHAHTFQNSPIAAVAALKVQEIIHEEKLVNNVNKLGPYLGESLKAILGDHPNVGDIRGMGFF